MNTTLINENMYQLLLSAKDSVGILLFQMIYSGGVREMKTVIKRTRFWETAVTIWYVWRRHFWC